MARHTLNVHILIRLHICLFVFQTVSKLTQRGGREISLGEREEIPIIKALWLLNLARE